MDKQQLNVLKQKELSRIAYLEKKGYKSSKKFTFADSYDAIVEERKRNAGGVCPGGSGG